LIRSIAGRQIIFGVLPVAPPAALLSCPEYTTPSQIVASVFPANTDVEPYDGINVQDTFIQHCFYGRMISSEIDEAIKKLLHKKKNPMRYLPQAINLLPAV